LGHTNGSSSWEIEIVPTPGLPTNSGTVYSGTLPYIATGLNPNTTYNFYVRALCGSINSAWVGPTSFTTTLAPLGCGGNFTDPGGAGSNYANNITAANGTTIICPDNATDLVTVTFTSFATENCCDHLSVYAGNSSSAPLIGTYQGTAIPPSVTSAAPGQCLTFVFTSDGSVTAAGWVANVVCAPAPTCSKPTSVATSAVLSTSATVSWTQPANPDTTTATAWEILALPCGSPLPTATTTGWVAAPTNPFTMTGLNPVTCYTFYVRAVCSASDSSTWSDGVNATTQAIPPACGGTFTDPGGATGAYANNITAANGTTTICPTNPTDLVTVTFTSFATENCCDHLSIYAGNSSAAPLIGTYQGTAIPPSATSTAPGECLTFVFTSDGSVTAAGWVANVTCAPAPTCSKPTSVATSAVLSTSTTLSWTQPANPDTTVATAWEVLALPCGSPLPTATTIGWVAAPSNPFTLTGLNPDTCYTFYVRAVCSASDSSTWSDGVNATTQPVPPACGGTFTDPGGSTGQYANNANVTTTICPDNPTDVVLIDFTAFNLENNFDFLQVYDGNSTAAPLLGTFTGTTIPGQLESSTAGGCLTFVFTSDGIVAADGWIANVTCVLAPTCPKPTNLTATVLTSTSASLTWNENGTATQWEVIIQPAGSGTPLPSATGIIVNGTPTYTATGLNPGVNYEYWVRAICSSSDMSFWNGPRTFFTQLSCGDSQPFCGDDGFIYGNTTGAPSYGSIDCLFTTPNPAWFFMQVENSGDLNLTITQGNNAPNYDNLDVDFICWGPFTSLDFNNVCANLYDYPDGNTSVTDNVIACSYSAAPIENFVIPNAQAGQYYIVLITNFSNQTGTVTFNQTNNGQTGAGSTNCDTVCSVDLGQDQILCNQTSYTITSTNQNADSYTWYYNNVLIPGQSQSTLTVTQSGDYRCLITCAGNTAEDIITITFNSPITPTFTAIPSICQNDTAPALATTSTNAIAGTWSPSTIDTATPGTTTYTFTPNAGQCATVTTMDITITPGVTPQFLTPAPFCSGSPAPILPTTSNNSITGTWSPSTVSNTASGTYTFTPNAGQCASIITMDITVLSNCSFGSHANAVWLENCANTTTNGDFYNTTGSGADIIGPAANIFPSTYYGTYLQNSGTFLFKGGEVKTFKSAMANVCSARLYYRVYQQATAPGTFTTINLPFFEDCNAGTFPSGGPCNPGDQKWQNVLSDALAVDLTAYAPGNYVIEVYYDVTGDVNSTTECDDTILINNNGANFIATYSIQATPTFTFTNPTTCNGSDGTITISGLTSNINYSVSYQDNGAPVAATTMTSTTNGEIIITGLNAGTYDNFVITANSCNFTGGTVTLVDPLTTMVLSSANDAQTVCINTAISDIVYTTTNGATDVTATGLPAGVIGSYNAGTFTISGTPTASGTFNYTVTTVGGCGTVTLNGTITVNPLTTMVLSSANDAQTVCINTAISDIVYTTSGATDVTLTGLLPAGVTGSYNAGTFTISGTPTASGTFNYTVTTVGGCGTVTLNGTITVNPLTTMVLSSANDAQTVCINTAISNIVYTATNGATDVTVTGLPAGVTGSYNAGTFTISGTPTASGTFNYTVTTVGGCGTVTLNGTITVNPLTTMVLSSANDAQTVCINTAISNIVYATNGATNVTVTGLPAGVTGSYNAGTFTISGTPTASGTFNYTVTTVGGCGTVTLNGTITVNPLTTMVLSSANDAQTVCINTAISNIVYTATNGATDVTVTGLPAGVTGSYNAGTFTISGTPTASGTFNYTVTTVGGCGTVTLNGTITVNPLTTMVLSSANDTQTVCINTAISNIVYATNGATNVTVTGLPAGVTGSYNAGTFTISGTPTASGTFNYTVTTVGGCGTVTLNGTITVNPLTTMVLSSANDTQTVCINTAISNIVYATNGATNVTVTGLPAGVTGSYNAGTFTISGTPTASGTFNYTVTTVGGCGTVTLNGTITVNPLTTMVLSSANDAQTVCINTAISNIVYTTTNGATNVTVTGLPAGVTGSYNAGTFTISGTPTASGTFNYTVTTVGGCGTVTLSGTISVTPLTTATFNPISICYNDAAPALPTTSLQGYTGTWSPSVISNTASGTYTFTPSAGQCAASGTLSVTVYSDFDYTIAEDCANNVSTLEVIASNSSFNEGTASYNWQYNGNQNIGANDAMFNVTNYVNSTSVTETFPMTISVTVTTTDGCSKTHSYTINDITCDIQRGISPNADGLNDFFDLRNMNVSELEIYNRYGVKVYSKGNYTNEWIGQADNGNELPDGTYYYVISFANNQEAKTGWIYINRQIK
jgi:gliding motility-associated-like protein